MKASKIVFGQEPRIRLDFTFDREVIRKIRTIPGVTYSAMGKIWHVPYTPEVFAQVKRLFPDVDYQGKQGGKGTPVSEAVRPGSSEPGIQENVDIEVLGRTIIIHLPKNQPDIRFIRSIRYSRWDKKQFCWIIPNYPGTLDLLLEYFQGRIRNLTEHEFLEVSGSTEEERRIRKDEVLIVRTLSGRLRLTFVHNLMLIRCIKALPYHRWDTQSKRWTVPYSAKILDELRSIIEKECLRVIYEEESGQTEKAPRISPHDVENYRRCPPEYRRKLIELRYSDNTVRTYCSLFEEFMNYYPEQDPQRMDEQMIIRFMQYLVIDRKVSLSYQNQSINAIKFYYERLLGEPRKIYLVERPRRERKLPVVLNEEEVARVIRGIDNLKHKAIIMMIYSSGLRLSELLNLRIKDIDSTRMQVFVRQSKGRKDRYTLLSKKVLPLLRAYIREYRPKEWLFEGMKGGPYSGGSVQAIARAAYRKAGIRKHVTVHTLRHCFGTHLLENGTDLRYIQALMGHESSKTTEVYTHITTKGFNQIVNPMDKLELE